jgi:hypothetical protein
MHCILLLLPPCLHALVDAAQFPLQLLPLANAGATHHLLLLLLLL